jgi:cation diffusion facilitator CzcD-associated flavoprotein CzcO
MDADRVQGDGEMSTLSEADTPIVASPAPKPETQMLIVGAGLGGLCMGALMSMAGRRDFVIIEKANDLGGTWRDNVYPGCACDVPSHLYSFSFAQKPDWSGLFPNQPEILAYIDEVAAEHGLRSHITFGAALLKAEWDEENAFWRVETSKGQITARHLVTAIGALHAPSIPKLSGMKAFAGKSFHSAQWDSSIDLTGANVAVIGTGASAIQFVPQIAGKIGKLGIYQRTAPWILPRFDRPLTSIERTLLRHIPGYKTLFRASLYAFYELRFPIFKGNRKMGAIAEALARTHLQSQIKDEILRQKLTPSYRLGCKRALIADDYYPTLLRENVELITDPIAQVQPHSIVTKDGRERPTDVIIYGTGFDVAGPFRRLDIIGRGVALADVWRDEMRSYLGLAVSGFPNFHMLLGPNTGLGHNSVIIMIEAQARHIMNCLDQMDAKNLHVIDVKPQAEAASFDDIQSRLVNSIWQAGGCRSWYQDERGRNIALWPGSTLDYERKTRRASLADYDAR